MPLALQRSVAKVEVDQTQGQFQSTHYMHSLYVEALAITISIEQS